MAFEIQRMNGSVASLISIIVIGIVLLFVGLFILSTLEPVFQDRLFECSNTNTAPSAGTELNATSASSLTTANITFASITNQRNFCTLVLNISNESATAGSYAEIRNSVSALLGNHTIPATYQEITTSETIAPATSGADYIVNITAFGDDNITLQTSGSYMRCCTTLVAQSGPAGRYYSDIVSLAGVAFGVFGIVLIIVGLAAAVNSLMSMK